MDRNMLHKATSSDPNPTPGYLYGEIAKMTQHGIPECDKITKYLLTRLKKTNPNVKLKTLVVTKHVCRKGSVSFRRSVQTHLVPEIKESLHFRGTPDPLRGDEPNKAVREAAKEALEAVFDSTTEASGTNSALSRRIEGFGNSVAPPADEAHRDDSASSTAASFAASIPAFLSSYTQGASSSSASHSSSHGGGIANPHTKYGGGIGNPNFQDPRNKPKGFFDRVKDRIDKYNDANGDSASKPGWMANSGSSDYNFASNRGGGADNGSGSYDPTASTSSTGGTGRYSNSSTSSKPRARGQIGGGWGAPSVSTTASHSSSGLNVFSPTRDRAGRTGGAATDGAYERTQIDELCSRGGVRAVPPADKLRSFVTACKTLDPQVVMPIVEEKLVDGEWKVKHKALCVCEALVKDPSCEPYADYIDEHPELLEELKESTQTSVRDRARRVWALLYEEDEPAPVNDKPKKTAATAKPAPAAPRPQSPTVNLLDFADEGDQPTSSSTDDTSTVTQSLNILDLSSTNNDAASTSNGGMFSGLSVSAPAPPAKQALVPGGTTANMFSEVTVKASEPAPSQSASSSLLDLYNNSTPEQPQPAKQDAPAAPGTAFSFIQQPSSTPTPPKPSNSEDADPAANLMDINTNLLDSLSSSDTPASTKPLNELQQAIQPNKQAPKPNVSKILQAMNSSSSSTPTQMGMASSGMAMPAMMPNNNGMMMPNNNGMMMPNPSGMMMPNPSGMMMPNPSGMMMPNNDMRNMQQQQQMMLMHMQQQMMMQQQQNMYVQQMQKMGSGNPTMPQGASSGVTKPANKADDRFSFVQDAMANTKT